MELLQVFGSSDQETESWFTNQEPLIPTTPHPPPILLLEERGGWAYFQIFKKGGLTGPQFLEGAGGKEVGHLFQREEAEFLEKKTN